jgi:thymidylate synthase
MMPSKPLFIESRSLGDCWLQVSRAILQQGQLVRYDEMPIKEIGLLTMTVELPNPEDEVIAALGDATWLAWMHDNFFVQKEVAELGNAPSYAIRLFNYAQAGLDQIEWVIAKLQDNPESRSATISTFMPLTDSTYIPCISLLDFWIPNQALGLVVYAHSLDFGKKAYGNLVELARLQDMVAQALGYPLGALTIHAKSAHIYEPEWAYMAQLLQNAALKQGQAAMALAPIP